MTSPVDPFVTRAPGTHSVSRMDQSRFGGLARIGAAVGLILAVAGIPSNAPEQALAEVVPQAAPQPGPQTPAVNPAMADSCGTNAVLVLDASGSINSSHAVENVRDAGEAFLDALADTGSTARVLQFASISQQLAGQTEVTAQSLQTGGVFRNAINGYYNPIPPRPVGVSIYNYRGSGNPTLPGQLDRGQQFQPVHELGPEPRPSRCAAATTGAADGAHRVRHRW